MTGRRIDVKDAKEKRPKAPSGRVTVFAPASIGNVGPGFDVLGMAVTGRGDTVTARVTLTPGVRILAITGDSRNLPLDPGKNTAGIAAGEVLRLLGVKQGVELSIHKNIPGSGMGSSAASAVAGAFAVNALFGGNLSKQDLLLPAASAESRVSGGYFLDNVGASLLGGIIVTNPFSKHTVSLGTIPGLHIVIVTPAVEVLTKKARAILPKEISMDDFVTNMANACGMVRAVQIKDAVLFGTSIHDAVVEPHRAGLIPGFFDVKRSALSAGALGCSISGAGASVFAVADRKETAVEVGRAMQEAFLRHKVVSVVTLAKVDKEGARVIG